MLKPAALFTFLLTSAGVNAQTLSGNAFEKYTNGKTLYFSESGEAYGAERYLPGRRVEWSFLDGKCKSGEWYADGQAICFVYEDRAEPQCWHFEITPNGLRATFLGEDQSTELYEARESDEPMYCIGPDVGV